MLSRQILLSNLLLSRRPILKTLPGFGLSKGSKLRRQRSSNFPGPNGRRQFNTITKEKFCYFLFFFSLLIIFIYLGIAIIRPILVGSVTKR